QHVQDRRRAGCPTQLQGQSDERRAVLERARVGAGRAPLMRFAARRLAQAIPLLFIVSVLVFALIHAAPGGPLSLYLDNPNVRPEDIARLRRAMGLDQPLGVQYVAWLGAFVRGDWGYSYADGRPVLARMLERLPPTLELVGVATLVAVGVSMVVGIAAALRRGADRAASVVAVAGLSIPVFWLGLVLPVTVLAVAHAAGWSRYLRGSMRLALAQPFANAARARGVTEGRIVLRHALRHALLPFATVVLL